MSLISTKKSFPQAPAFLSKSHGQQCYVFPIMGSNFDADGFWNPGGISTPRTCLLQLALKLLFDPTRDINLFVEFRSEKQLLFAAFCKSYFSLKTELTWQWLEAVFKSCSIESAASIKGDSKLMQMGLKFWAQIAQNKHSVSLVSALIKTKWLLHE